MAEGVSDLEGITDEPLEAQSEFAWDISVATRETNHAEDGIWFENDRARQILESETSPLPAPPDGVQLFCSDNRPSNITSIGPFAQGAWRMRPTGGQMPRDLTKIKLQSLSRPEMVDNAALSDPAGVAIIKISHMNSDNPNIEARVYALICHPDHVNALPRKQGAFLTKMPTGKKAAKLELSNATAAAELVDASSTTEELRLAAARMQRALEAARKADVSNDALEVARCRARKAEVDTMCAAAAQREAAAAAASSASSASPGSSSLPETKGAAVPPPQPLFRSCSKTGSALFKSSISPEVDQRHILHRRHRLSWRWHHHHRV
jgi:hypothetical protein